MKREVAVWVNYCLALTGNFRRVCPSKSGEYECSTGSVYACCFLTAASPESVYIKPNKDTPGSVFSASTSIKLYTMRRHTHGSK